ncbi:MAG: ATP-binding protein [Oscillospiraceae bacterium]|nr:ATP-binding protein [Oscillospiraceae bacterium]
MKYTDIVTDSKSSAKAAWFVFTLCTVIMYAMTYFNNWETWVMAALIIHDVILTVMTFFPKIPVKAQSAVLMVFSFSNIFICSIMENDIYPSIAVFISAAILVAVYKNIRLLIEYALLTGAGILYHIFVLRSVSFDTMTDITNFVVRVSVMMTAQFFLIVFIGSMAKYEEEMKKSVEEARQAERYKSDFLANMSHEIRTPMNAIVGMCELILRENGLSESVRENCFNIQTSGRNLLAIINDILDFSKIDSGKMELIYDEFNIASTLNDVINMSEARKGSKKIDIIVNADPNIPRGLVCDEVRLRQVIINLMTNGIKYTEQGFVTLTVSQTKQDYGINLFVSVADTGIGITEENIEKLFTSFRQVDTKKNRSVEGTGLGLAISKRLITQMGGFISVKSEYGKGSEFRFAIPVKVSDDRPFITIKDSEKVHSLGFFGTTDRDRQYKNIFIDMGRRLGVDFKYTSDPDRLKEMTDSGSFTHVFAGKEEYISNSDFFDGLSEKTKVFVIQERIDAITLPDTIKCIYKPFYVLSVASALNNENIVINLSERRGADIRFIAPKARILIVDDNAINLKVAAGLMQPYHMQIMTAESGPAAIRMLRSKDIDLVFMDHMMPEMDGIEATKIIRDMDGDYYKKLPIVALTANAVNGVKEMFIREGLNDFLAKPIEISALDRILRAYLPGEYKQSPATAEYGKNDRRSGNRANSGGPKMFDPDKGLMYTGGDDSVYREILSLYVKKGPEKIEYIGGLYDKKDWKNYIIEVHALKSTSLSIGAEKLSALAKELEAAGKSGNYRTIDRKNDALLKMYGNVIDIAKEYLGGNDESSEEQSLEDAGLTEISAELLSELIQKAKDACGSFDGDAMSEIAEKAEAYSHNGEPLKKYFGRAAELAEDFEYESAAAEIEKLDVSGEASV